MRHNSKFTLTPYLLRQRQPQAKRRGRLRNLSLPSTPHGGARRPPRPQTRPNNKSQMRDRMAKRIRQN